MILKRLFLVMLAFSSCKRAPEVEPIPYASEFSHYESRLMDFFLSERDFVVSRTEDDGMDDQGDSLLFSGIALGVVSCDKVPRLLSALKSSQETFRGFLVRFNPLPPEYITGKNYVSRDGAIGALFGLVRAAKRCPEQNALIQTVMDDWRAAVGSSYLLHPKSVAVLTPSFRFFWDAAHGHEMSNGEYGFFMATNLFTAEAIRSNRSACYPVNLQLLEFLTLEVMGRRLELADKRKWCETTDGMGNLLADWYCGRGTEAIESWLANPEQSSHVYAHQRCGWESPDIGSKKSPRVDFLLLSRLLNEGSNPW